MSSTRTLEEEIRQTDIQIDGRTDRQTEGGGFPPATLRLGASEKKAKAAVKLKQLREGSHPAVDQLVQQRQLVRQPRDGHEVAQVARQEGAYPPAQRGRAVRTLLQLGHHPKRRKY